MTRRSWMCAVAILVLLPAAIAGADELAVPRIDALHLGFSGREQSNQYKIGVWTPIEVTLTGAGAPIKARVDLVVPDGDGVPSSFTGSELVALAPGDRRTVVLYAKFGRTNGPLTVTVRDGDQVVAERTFSKSEVPRALRATQRMMLAVGPQIDFSGAIAAPQSEEFATHVVRLDGVDYLPYSWLGYEGVDVLILTTSRPEIFRTLRPAQITALEQWINLGGRLVWCAGREAKAVLVKPFPLAGFASGTFEEMVPLRQGAGLEGYVGTTDRLDAASPDQRARFRLEVPRLSNVKGRIEAYDGARATDLPLVVREPRGLGEIVFAGVDLDLPPIAGWSGRARLLSQLLGDHQSTDPQPISAARQGLHAGFDDLSGQLRGALDQFQSAPLIPFWVVGMLIVLYIVAIGPVDYYLVKRVLGRMELTWITFPIWAVLFCGLALMLAQRYKGSELRYNQIDLVDIEQSTNLVRGTTWANLFSPENDSYTVALDPSAMVSGDATRSSVAFSWFGLPGSGIGGMHSESIAPLVDAPPYRFSPTLDQMDAVPIRVWSSKHFMGRWGGALEADSRWLLSSNVTRDQYGALRGKLTNSLRRTSESQQPDLPLEDCTVYFGNLAYLVGRFEPGREIVLEEISPRTMEGLLTRRRPSGDRDVATPYDQYDLDPMRILEIMTFHEIAGGRKYTHLVNQYQAFVELSDQLRAGRAVVVGRFASPVVTLKRDGRPLAGAPDIHRTLFRYILPVSEREK